MPSVCLVQHPSVVIRCLGRGVSSYGEKSGHVPTGDLRSDGVRGGAAVTNPSHETHKQTVYKSMAAEATAAALGKIAVDLLGDVDVVPLQYHNYFLFSTTTLHGETKSLGVFSRVGLEVGLAAGQAQPLRVLRASRGNFLFG